MNNITSVRQGRLRPSFIWVVVFVLVMMLAACSGNGEPEATRVATTAAPTSTPATTATAESEQVEAPTEEPAAEPTDAPAPTMEPTAESGSIPQKGALPVVDEVSFEVLAQYGGVPSAVAVADGVAYVGFGPRLMTIDVSDPANPQMLGETSLLADNIQDIAVADGFAYLAARRAGLVVVDATDAANPEIVDEGPNYSGTNPPSADTVQVEDDLAYLTDFNRSNGEVSLVVFDISDPADVQFVDSLPVQVNDTLTVDNGRLVIVGNGRIEVQDTADLGATLGEAPLTGGDYSSRVVVRGNMAYVVETGIVAGVETFDISNPETPALVGEIAPMEIFLASQVVAAETTLFSVGTFGEFGFCDSQIDVIDISSPEAESVTRLSPEICVTDVVVEDTLLYVVGRNGLKIFDVTEPSAVQEGTLFINPDGFHDAQAVALDGDVTYILTGEGSGTELRMLNLMGETAELYADVLPLGSTVVLDLFVTGETLVAPQWQGSLFTFGLADPTVPQLLFSPEDEAIFSSGDMLSYVVNGDVVYLPVVDGTLIGGIGVVDLSDPANPQLASTFETGDYMVMHMTGGNGYLYVLVQGEAFTIHIYDISQPLAPLEVGVVTMPEATNRIALNGDTLYAVCDRFNCQSLYTIDVSEPAAAEITGQWQINVGAADLIPAGEGMFFLTTFEQGIWLLDGSDPANPALVGLIQLPGDYARLKVGNGFVYAATYDGGLYVLGID